MQLSLGEIDLEMDLAHPRHRNSPKLMLAHPHPRMGGTMDNKVILELHRRATARGWGSLRFNFRGVGKSTGVHDQGHGETQDLLNLMAWVENEWACAASQLFLCGYSFGAWIVARAVAAGAAPKGVFFLAPPVGRVSFPDLSRCPVPKWLYAAGEDSISLLSDLKSAFTGWMEPKTLRVVRGADHFFVGHTVKLLHQVMEDVEGAWGGGSPTQKHLGVDE